MSRVDISLNPVSYVVLGFAARESPVTSYDLKQMVASSVGYSTKRSKTTVAGAGCTASP